jgi:hypothetical protein
MRRRLGRFTASNEFVYGLARGEGLNVFAGGAVIDVRHDYSMDQVEYVMYHPSFDPVPAGEILPEYTAVFTLGVVVPTWARKEPK